MQPFTKELIQNQQNYCVQMDVTFYLGFVWTSVLIVQDASLCSVLNWQLGCPGHQKTSSDS